MLDEAHVGPPHAGPLSGTRGIVDVRVLVMTNMYPTEDDPAFGCFVRDQVDDLKALGARIAVLAFDGRPSGRQLGGC